MPNVNGPTLVMAIQAVDEMITSLSKQVDEDEEGEIEDTESLLLSYTKAAANLRVAYGEALKELSNLPPYEELVQNLD